MNTTQTVTRVGMADFKLLKKEGILRTLGLGSCIGLTLYDPRHKVAGMAHMMLPDSSIMKETDTLQSAKYVNTAIPALIEQMKQSGGNPNLFVSKIVGGAQMFANVLGTDTMRIGPRNIEASKNMLAAYGIPIIGEETGGTIGRSITLDVSTGILTIHSVLKGVRQL